MHQVVRQISDLFRSSLACSFDRSFFESSVEEMSEYEKLCDPLPDRITV